MRDPSYVLERVILDLAAGKKGVATEEWAPFYDIPTELEPDSLADRFDIVAGAYQACADWHGGQWSRGYRHLCKLGRQFRPSPLGVRLEGDTLAAYVRVAVSLVRLP